MALAGAQRILDESGALRGRGQGAARQHQPVAVHHHPFRRPEIEMADPLLLVDRGDQRHHLGRRRSGALRSKAQGHVQGSRSGSQVKAIW